VSYWLIGLLVWIAPAVLLGCVLLGVRFKTSPVSHALSDSIEQVKPANDAEEMLPQFAMMVAAE
jgi:hypothetical protein